MKSEVNVRHISQLSLKIDYSLETFKSMLN